MPRVCTICAHEEREAIDKALLNGGSFRDIAGQFTVSRSALDRHKASHLMEHLAQAKEAAEVIRADDLLFQVRSLQAKTLAILTKAEQEGDLRGALMAISQARQNLELLARLLGELDERATVNILVSPQWIKLRAAIMRSLEAHPEARYALAAALEGVES